MTQVNEHGNNANIRIHLFPEERMRELHFSDLREGWWTRWKILKSTISFNISINKEDPTNYRIDILDDDYLQPYDYEWLLDREPDFQFAKDIKNLVEEQMMRLVSEGIVSGWAPGDYV